MPVKTKNVFATPEDTDGERYLISRYNTARPKSFKDCHITRWLRALGPSKELHRDWYPQDKNKKQISPREYTERYYREIRESPKAQEALEYLRQKHTQNQTITLLCKC